MKNLKILAFALIVILSACNKDDDENHISCDVDNPLEDLTWLRDTKQVFEDLAPQSAKIIQYNYNGAEVFWVDGCFQCPDVLVYVRDCEGEIICEFGGIGGLNTCPDFDENISNKIILFEN